MIKGTNYPRIAANGQQFHVFILLVPIETRMKSISRGIENHPRESSEQKRKRALWCSRPENVGIASGTAYTLPSNNRKKRGGGCRAAAGTLPPHPKSLTSQIKESSAILDCPLQPTSSLHCCAFYLVHYWETGLSLHNALLTVRPLR